MKLTTEQKAVIDEIQSEIAYHQRLTAYLQNRLNQRLAVYASELGIDVNDGDWEYRDGEFLAGAGEPANSGESLASSPSTLEDSGLACKREEADDGTLCERDST